MAEARTEILEWDGEPCGYLAVEVEAAKVIIHELVLHPDHQNRGIGTAVLLETVSLGRGLGVPVHLQVLQESHAARLYERLGFEECGRTTTHRLMYLRP